MASSENRSNESLTRKRWQGDGDDSGKGSNTVTTTTMMTTTVHVPAHKLGAIIGRNGENLAEVRRRTQCLIQLPPRGQPPDADGMARILIRNGDVEEAKLLLKRLANNDRGLGPPFVGVEARNIPKLYVDILNFVDLHFFRDQDDWSIPPVLNRMVSFVQAANACGVSLIIFIDAVRTDEALDKWRDRMTRAVMQGRRGVPQNISGIMAELCVRAGVAEVRLSTAVNNDDTMASYAAHDKVPILSGDKDFMRYVYANDGRPCELTLYNNYQVKEGKLFLSLRNSGRAVPIQEHEKRVLAEPPPPYHLHGIDEDAWVHDLSRKRSFRGGAPSPLVRALGFNPYLRIRPLRIALYRELLKDSLDLPIREEFPVFEPVTQTVQFSEESLSISDTDCGKENHQRMVQLLMTPKEAFAQFFPRECDTRPPQGISEGDWYRHCHGCKVIVIELCCYLPANKERNMRFLDVLVDSDTWRW